MRPVHPGTARSDALSVHDFRVSFSFDRLSQAAPCGREHSIHTPRVQPEHSSCAKTSYRWITAPASYPCWPGYWDQRIYLQTYCCPWRLEQPTRNLRRVLQRIALEHDDRGSRRGICRPVSPYHSGCWIHGLALSSPYLSMGKQVVPRGPALLRSLWFLEKL